MPLASLDYFDAWTLKPVHWELILCQTCIDKQREPAPHTLTLYLMLHNV